MIEKIISNERNIHMTPNSEVKIREEEKIVVEWNFNYNLFAKNPAPDNSPLPKSTEALFSFLLLPSLFLYWFKSKQSHLIMYRGRDCKVFIEPMWKWFSCIISCNCDCNTETDQNRLASYFPSGWLWAYLNISRLAWLSYRIEIAVAD